VIEVCTESMRCQVQNGSWNLQGPAGQICRKVVSAEEPSNKALTSPIVLFTSVQ